MQPSSSQDARPSFTKGEKPTLEDTVDAELWLNLMTSMMNFAVASTNLMKSIQEKTGFSVDYKDGNENPEETIKSQEYEGLEEVVEDVCTIKTCTVLGQNEGEESEAPEVEENKGDETDVTDTEMPSDITEPQSEAQEELSKAEELQTEESSNEPENKETVEPTEKTNEEQLEGAPTETDAIEEVQEKSEDEKDQQQSAEPGLEKKTPEKTCNVLYQKKESYKELCSGSCGKFPESRIPLPVKRKKHKYSTESQKKIEDAKEEMGKPPKRPCGCRLEECLDIPCSCEDFTLCTPSKVPGVCLCAEKPKTEEAAPEEAAILANEKELAVKEEVPQLLTGPTPYQMEVTTVEMSVQATEVVSEMCCCDEKFIDEAVLAVDGEYGCQTDPTESFPDFELSTISQHLQQTDENLEELRKEVQRISDCITGRKRYADEVAAALYREIMKPRMSIVEVTGQSHRMSPKRRDQVLETFLELVLMALDSMKIQDHVLIREERLLKECPL